MIKGQTPPNELGSDYIVKLILRSTEGPELTTEMASVQLRAPICCVLGHVDAGKTSLLDKLRTSNVASGEAGGITQQIGATYFPLSALQQLITPVSEKLKVRAEIPGILILDTPGHANFTNLRSRGSSICDIAIVVVDYFDGLQPQTKESLMLLRKHKTPFIVVVNKIDRLYGWKSHPEMSIVDTLKTQSADVREQIDSQIGSIIAELAGEEFNSQLYYKNKDHKRWINIVPVSAKSGDGIPDLLALVMQLTQKLMVKDLTVQSEFRCVVMEVKKTEGYGTTLDVILVDGTLAVGDLIVVCGLKEAIVANVRALLLPHALQELRVKGQYHSVDNVTAAQCLKIAASGLDDAVAGTSMYIARDAVETQEYSITVQNELQGLEKYDTNANGVYVKASTLGSLQALHAYLTEKNMPISTMGIGPITRKDLVKAGTLVERSPRHACILAFDLSFTDSDLQTFADKQGLEIFTNDVMYQLVEEYTKFLERMQVRLKRYVVYPCELELREEWIFRASNPMILGCKVVTGRVAQGTPLVDSTGLQIGVVREIFVEGKFSDVPVCNGTECSLQIGGKNVVAGRHFLKNVTESAYSEISRRSIDALKEVSIDLTQDELRLIVKIKKLLNVV